MKDNVILYAKSQKVFTVEYAQLPITHTGWWVDGYGALPMAIRTTHNFKPQDQEALHLLKESGITYELVDLSDCSFIARLKAKMSGIDETPVLIVNHKKIRGVENIRHALKGTKIQK